jgi:D-alanyl-D-alanine carboxypeptidase (penicillin-binding protein 5/6)
MTASRLFPILFLSSLSLLHASPAPPDVKGVSVAVVDATTGEILYERNAREHRPVGSTQKLLTALLVAERGNLDKDVLIEPEDENAEPTTLHLTPGTSYPRGTLLSALLVKSANDVARALGRDHSGSLEAFAAAMNAKALSLGADSSNFVNPNGLPAEDQYSTAADMARIARAAYADPTLRPIMGTKYLSFRYADGRVHMLRNTNQTMRENWFCTGMKTGYTEKSRHCLITSGTHGGREVISVILGSSKDRIFTDSARMLRWALGLPQESAAPAVMASRKKSGPRAQKQQATQRKHRSRSASRS